MARTATKTRTAASKPTRKVKMASHRTVKSRKVIALFPEAAFGPALNSVGIGQALEKLGHKVVFLSDPAFLS